MAIDYEKIQQSINEYAQYILNCIKNQYDSSLTTEQLQNIESLLNTDFIIIEKPTKADIEFFSKQEGITNPEDYSAEYIPSAHGGRTKKDNKIHIYPYAKSFSSCKSNEDIIQTCIDSIVIHEIFHYFIRPDLSNENNPLKEEFGHFITEGLVQYYTEEFAKKFRLGTPKSNYGKNVEFVKQLIASFPDNLTQTQIDKIIFSSNLDELLHIAQKGDIMYKEYVNNYQFKEDIASLITNIGIDMGMDKKELENIKKHYRKVEDVDIIFEDLSKNIEQTFKENKELRDNYIKKLRELIRNKISIIQNIQNNLNEKDDSQAYQTQNVQEDTIRHGMHK